MNEPNALTPTGILIIIGALIWIVAGIIVAVRMGVPADTAAANKLNEAAANPLVLQEMRLAYRQAGQMQQQALDTALAILTLIAPLTPGIKTDDAARDLLDKINDKGNDPPAPAEPPAVGK